MRSYEEAWEHAVDKPAFSNGTEGMCWQANWCDRCLREAPYRNGLKGAQGCPLVLVALLGRTPSEWIEQPWRQIKGRPEGELAPSLGDKYHCLEFRGPGGGGDPEPRPKPEPPRMDGLFERPERQVRMLKQPEQVGLPHLVG